MIIIIGKTNLEKCLEKINLLSVISLLAFQRYYHIKIIIKNTIKVIK